MVNKEYGVMDFGFETYEIINPNYAKLVFKLNNAGNLTIEAIPSLTPGVKPEGTQHGKVPKGTKVFDYETKIIISLSYSDCINISNLAKGFVSPIPTFPFTTIMPDVSFNNLPVIPSNTGTELSTDDAGPSTLPSVKLVKSSCIVAISSSIFFLKGLKVLKR